MADRKVYITVPVKLILTLEEGVTVESAMSNLDVVSDESISIVEDAQFGEPEITDSR